MAQLYAHNRNRLSQNHRPVHQGVYSYLLLHQGAQGVLVEPGDEEHHRPEYTCRQWPPMTPGIWESSGVRSKNLGWRTTPRSRSSVANSYPWRSCTAGSGSWSSGRTRSLSFSKKRWPQRDQQLAAHCHGLYVPKIVYRNICQSTEEKGKIQRTVWWHPKGLPGILTETFDFTMEVVLRALKKARRLGFRLNNLLLNHLAYADDVAPMIDSVEDMRRLIEELEKATKATGLTINPENYVSLHVNVKAPADRDRPANRIYNHGEDDRFLKWILFLFLDLFV